MARATDKKITIFGYKNAFIKKHCKTDWNVVTSPMNEDGGYTKVYYFHDGATLWEETRPIIEHIQIPTEVRGVKVVADAHIQFLETSCWNSEDETKVTFYERW